MAAQRRALLLAQLRGEHVAPRLGNLEVDWRANVARTLLDQPDLRQAAIRASEREDDDGTVTTAYSLVGTPPGPQRYFRDLDERASLSSALHAAWRIAEAALASPDAEVRHSGAVLDAALRDLALKQRRNRSKSADCCFSGPYTMACLLVPLP